MTPQQRAFKAAFRALVDDIGGFDPAAALLSYPKGHLSLAAGLNHPEASPRVDHAAALELLAGKPRVTEQMALASGYWLLPVAPAAGTEGAALAEVLGNAGELGRRAALALGDGRVEDAERAGLVEQLGVLARVVATAQSIIAGPALKLRSVV